MSYARRLPLFAVLVSLCIAASPADKPLFDAGTAEKVIQKFVQLQEPARRRNWSYQEERIVEQLDSHGRILASTHEIFEWRLMGGVRESRRLELNGARQMESFIRESAPAGVPDWNFEKVTRRYDFKIAAFEKFQGRDVARIHFTPKKSQPGASGILEKVMSSLQGDLWALFDQKQLLKARARLVGPVRFNVLLGKIGKMEIFYQQQLIGDEWLPESFRFEIRMRRLFSRTRQRESRRYFNFLELPSAA